MTLERDDDIRLAEEDAAQADIDTAGRTDEEEAEVAEIRAEIEETAKGMSDMVMETIKRNPIPAAMAGAGLALLWMNRSGGSNGSGNGQRYGYQAYGDRGYSGGYGGQYGSGWQDVNQGSGGIASKAGDAVSTVGDVAGQAAGTVGNTVGQVGQTAGQVTGEVIDRGQQVVQDVGWRVERFMQASPLAVGAISIGAGALVGALLPETEQERQVLGDASRQVGSTVRDTVSDVTQKAEQKLDETEQQMASSGTNA